MSDSNKYALVLHVVGGSEPLVYALSEGAALNLADRLPKLMMSGAVDSPELENGGTVSINFAHVVSAHFDAMPPLSHYYGSGNRSKHGFGK
jgi:hypothetical protein